jgi:hypothetical protein
VLELLTAPDVSGHVVETFKEKDRKTGGKEKKILN